MYLLDIKSSLSPTRNGLDLIWPEHQPKYVFHQIEFVDKLNLETQTPGGMLVLQVLVLRLRLRRREEEGHVEQNFRLEICVQNSSTKKLPKVRIKWVQPCRIL